MSGFTVLFQRDERPVDPALLRRMNESIRHRGPDGSGYWVEGPVGLAHQMLHTTPEAVLEHQPTISSRGDLVLVYEGLIDNGDEIRHAARVKNLTVADRTDATAILLAYQLWRDDCTEHLSGDFAFVIWDRSARRCFCARDQMGIRPFYYHLDDKLLLCGSEVRQFLRHPSIRRDPNEGMVAEYLACAITSTEDTLYRDIQRLPAAHSLSVSADRQAMRRYWTFDPQHTIHFRTDGEYAEALFAEMSTAVRACARTIGPLGMELSGGLDSSSVVAVARALTARGVISAPIQTFSASYPGLDCDEGEYVAEADRFWGGSTIRVPFALRSKAEFYTSLAEHQDLPEYPNGASNYPRYREARDTGCRVLVGGEGGDECLTGHSLHYADMLGRFRILALLEQIRHDLAVDTSRHQASVTKALRALWDSGLRPLISAPVRRFAGRVRTPGYPAWISGQFANAVGLSARLNRPVTVRPPWKSRAQEAMFQAMTSGWVYHGHESASRILAEHGLEQRSPFLRLNVVRFGLGVPEDQRWRRSEIKFVLRQAMKGSLPERIRTRPTKTDFSELFPRALSRLGAGSTYGSLHLVSVGWLDSERVNEMSLRLAAWRPGSSTASVPIWPLWMIFSVECWLKTMASAVDDTLVEQNALNWRFTDERYQDHETGSGSRPEKTQALRSPEVDSLWHDREAHEGRPRIGC